MKRAHTLPSLQKAIVYLTLGVEVILTASALLLNQLSLRADRQLLSEAMAGSLVYSAEQLTQAIEQTQTLSDHIYGNAQVQEQLALNLREENTPEKRYTYHALYNLLLSFYRPTSSQPLRSISLVTPEYTVTAGQGGVPDEVYAALDRQAEATDGRCLIETRWSREYGVLLYRSVRQISPFSLRKLGTLVLCLDTPTLIREAASFNNQYPSSLYVLRDGEREIYASPELSGLALSGLLGKDGQDHGVLALGGHHYFWQRGRVEAYGFEYICMVVYDRQWRALRDSLVLFVGMMLLALGVSCVLSHVLSVSISGDFTSLIEKMHSFRGSPLPPGPERAVKIAEVSILHQQFDQMTGEISRLIQDKYVSELLAKDMQLQSLEAQMNPHFIYNVLDSINWRARAAGQTDISEIVDALGRFLRVSLSQRRKLIPLSEELELVGCYILIQQYRFEEHLDYQCHVPQSLYGFEVPKLVIQPLVENAIKYAVETSLDECCRIVVDARMEEGRLLVEVRNSGSEFEEELLKRLREGVAQTHGFGVGLRNIDQRMRLTYGEDYGLTLLNENGFAVCRLYFPQPGRQTERKEGVSC